MSSPFCSFKQASPAIVLDTWLFWAILSLLPAASLAQRTRIPPPPRPDLPVVYGMAWDENEQGMPLIVRVTPQSPADEAGVLPGDVVDSVNKQPVGSSRELASALTGHRVGARIELHVVRDRRPINLQLVANNTLPLLPTPDGSLTTGAARAPKPGPVSPPVRSDAGRVFGMVLQETDQGLMIREVAAGSPAAVAGVQPGDVLLTVGKTDVASYVGVIRAFDIVKPATEIPLAVTRGDETVDLALVIGQPATSRPAVNYDELRAAASHVIVGGVKAIYSFDQSTEDWQVSSRVAEVSVATVEKGDGIEPGQLHYARYVVTTRLPADPAAVQTPYPNVRSVFRLFLQRAADGGYDVMLPDGVQVVKAEPPPAPTTPAAVLPAPLGIDGVVILGDRPGPGVQVDLWDAAGLLASVVSNEQGRFRFDVPPGRYMVSARAGGPGAARVAPPSTVMVAGDRPTPLRIVLP